MVARTQAYVQNKKQKTKKSSALHRFSAERGGFEPPKPFWGLLAFQAGQFNHSCIFPFATTKIAQFEQLHNYLFLLLPNFTIFVVLNNKILGL